MAIRAPRIRRSSAAGRESRSRPSNRAWPDTCAPWVRPMTVSMVTLLPDPDSPTTPITVPGRRSRSTPRTACRGPSGVEKVTRRSRTWSRGALMGRWRQGPAARRGGPPATRRRGSGRGAGPRWSPPPARWSLQPHVGDVAVPGEGGDDVVLHPGGAHEVQLLVEHRDHGRVLHDLEVGVVPVLPRLIRGGGGQRLVDVGVDDRAVVVTEVGAVGTVGPAVEERLDHGPAVVAVPVRHPA